MANPYRIVFTGRLAAGADPQAAREGLARALGEDLVRVERLFERGRHVLKRVADAAEAERCVAALARAGIQADVECASLPPSAPGRAVAAVEPVSGRLLFLLGLPLVTAGAMLLLAAGPLLAFVALAAGGGGVVALHALAAGLPTPLLIALDLLLAGAGLFGALFFAKPFLPAAPVAALPLQADDEPDLFALAAAAAGAVGAPPLRGIVLLPAPEAGMHRLADGGVVLYLGLPLLRSASVADLAGLIAHAASPWAPRLGGPFARLLASCDRRLERAAEAPDALDRRLDRWRGGRVAWSRRLAAASKAVPRRLLRAERRLAGRYLARLTVDADAAQAALAGTDAFDGSWRRARLLTAIHGRLLDAAPAWQAAGRFPADLAARAEAIAGGLSAAAVQALLAAADQGLRAAGRADDANRRRHRPAAAGLVPFTCPRPARELVRRLPLYGRRQALRLYRHGLGMAVTGNRMAVPASPARAAIEGYFGGVFEPFVPIRPRFREDWEGPRQVVAEWAEVVGGLGRLATRGQAALERLTAADAALIDHVQRLLLLRAGRPLRDGGEMDADRLHAACRREEGEVDGALGTLVPYTARVTRRLCAALTLLAFAESEGRLDGVAPMLVEARRLTAFLDRTAAILPALRRLRWHLLALEVLLAEPGRPSRLMADRTEELTADLRQELAAVTAALGDLSHPLQRRPTPFLAWARAGVPEGRSAERLLELGEALLDRILRTQEGATARLAAIASRVEAAWGLST